MGGKSACLALLRLDAGGLDGAGVSLGFVLENSRIFRRAATGRLDACRVECLNHVGLPDQFRYFFADSLYHGGRRPGGCAAIAGW